MAEKNSPINIGDTTIYPGEKITIALPTPELYTCTPMHIPIHVIHGKKKGPILLICAALHADETNGVVLIQKLLNSPFLKSIQGTLIAIPVVNVYGLITNSRYLPDRRDLEANFPGSKKGTFAERLAYFLNTKIFNLATHIIQIQTGEPHYHKFPQIHTNTNIPQALTLASSFDIPFISHNESNKGLLWKMKENTQTITMIYEGGEALHLDAQVIRIGFNGILKSMKSIGLLSSKTKPTKFNKTMIINSFNWIRSPSSGIAQLIKKAGTFIKKNETIAIVTDPFGTKQTSNISSPTDGIIIGNYNFPLINEGDSLLQIAPLDCITKLKEHSNNLENQT